MTNADFIWMVDCSKCRVKFDSMTMMHSYYVGSEYTLHICKSCYRKISKLVKQRDNAEKMLVAAIRGSK